MVASPIAPVVTFNEGFDTLPTLWWLNLECRAFPLKLLRHEGTWCLGLFPLYQWKIRKHFFVVWCDNCVIFVMWHRVVRYCYGYSTFVMCHISMCSSVRTVTYRRHITSGQWPVSNALWVFGTLKFRHTKPRGFSLSFTGAAAQLGIGRLTVHTQSEGLLWVSDQSVAETSTYTANNEHIRGTFMLSTGFEGAIPMIERPLGSAVRSENWYGINLEGCFKLCVGCISFHVHSYVLCAVQNHPILALHNHCTWKNVHTQFE